MLNEKNLNPIVCFDSLFIQYLHIMNTNGIMSLVRGRIYRIYLRQEFVTYSFVREACQKKKLQILRHCPCKVSGISKVALPTKSMESGQQPFYFTGMFLLKLAGHVTKLSINSNWLLVFILLSVINFIGWRVYSCLVH